MVFTGKIDAIKTIRTLVSQVSVREVPSMTAGVASKYELVFALGLREAKDIVEACMELGARDQKLRMLEEMDRALAPFRSNAGPSW